MHRGSRGISAKSGGMHVLLVCPEFPDTFWSFKHALRFVNKRAAHPPRSFRLAIAGHHFRRTVEAHAV